MVEVPSIIVAFIAGISSVLAPCVFPIIPGYISYVTGVSLSKAYMDMKHYKRVVRVFLHSLAFAVGFIGIFIVVGASIGKISEIFLLNKRIFQQIGGVLIVIFGIMSSGLISFKFMQIEKKIKLPKFLDRFDYIRSFVLGILFAVGWSPCYGPIIGALFSLVIVKGSASVGMMLLFVYSLGFMIPFLLTAIFAGSFVGFLKNHQTALNIFRGIASLIIVAIGIMLITGDFNDLVVYIQYNFEVGRL